MSVTPKLTVALTRADPVLCGSSVEEGLSLPTPEHPEILQVDAYDLGRPARHTPIHPPKPTGDPLPSLPRSELLVVRGRLHAAVDQDLRSHAGPRRRGASASQTHVLVISPATMGMPMSNTTSSVVSRARAQRAPSVRPLFRAKAPLRVSFAGGGTDVAPFPEREGGMVLSATINRYAHGILQPRADGRIRVESLDLDTALEYGTEEQVEYDGKLDLVKAAVRRVAQLEEPRGIDLFLRTAAPPGSGLGASSALIVGLIGVLADYHKLSFSDYEIAHLAWEIERVDLGLKGGLQDQYAATFGGFNFMEFTASGVVVNPLRIKPMILNELESNLLLCFTGATRAGDHIIDDQTKRYESSDGEALTGLRMQKELAVSMKEALLRGRLTEFGQLMATAWEYKKWMSPRIATPAIDEAYEEALKQGALGGKITGAGGGGFMLFYCRAGRQHRVANRLREIGLEPSEFAFDHEGLRTWTYVEN